jgi:hypothetical protein
MVFPMLLCPHYRLRRESSVLSAIKTCRTARSFGRIRKNGPHPVVKYDTGCGHSWPKLSRKSWMG